MKIVVVGGGGREHAIIKKLRESRGVDKIYALPGNGGMGAIAPNPYYTKDIADECMEKIFLPTINAMKAEGQPYVCCAGAKLSEDGVSVPWLLLFKNETHNHPTEIEPFGGAATCIGGAIRDPLVRTLLCLRRNACYRRCRSFKASQ